MKPVQTLLLWALMAACGWAGAAPRNGDWWNGLQPAERVAYSSGFLEGNTYAAFAVSGAIRRTLIDPRSGQRDPQRAALAEDIMRMNVEAIQGEVDGIDPLRLSSLATALYADPRNADVGIFEIFYAAIRSLRGAPQAETQRFLESRRGSGGK